MQLVDRSRRADAHGHSRKILPAGLARWSDEMRPVQLAANISRIRSASRAAATGAASVAEANRWCLILV
jgi:hypothetical protein